MLKLLHTYRKLIARFITLTLLCLQIANANDNTTTIIIADQDSNLHKNFIKELKLKNKFSTTISIEQLTKPNGKLLIALGNNLCKKSLTHSKNNKLLCLLTPSYEFEKITKSIKHRNIGALYIDQPINRRLKFIKDKMKKIESIAIIKSDTKKINYDNFDSLSIDEYTLSKNQSIHQVIDSISEDNCAILAIEDINVYNRKNIKTLLLQSYRKKLPIIGFSENFTKAGAAASIHSSLKDIAKETDEVIDSYINDRLIELPIKYPKYYSYSFNKHVGINLNLTIEDYNE